LGGQLLELALRNPVYGAEEAKQLDATQGEGLQLVL
jgi:hypothetical protein